MTQAPFSSPSSICCHHPQHLPCTLPASLITNNSNHLHLYPFYLLPIMPRIRHSFKYFFSLLTPTSTISTWTSLENECFGISLFLKYNGHLIASLPSLHSPDTKMHQFNHTHQYLNFPCPCCFISHIQQNSNRKPSVYSFTVEILNTY